MNEHDTQNLVMIALSEHYGALVTRVNAGKSIGLSGGLMKGAAAGTADLICCIAGRYFEVEIKSATGRQSPQQALRQAAVTAQGGTYILARNPEGAIEGVRAALVVTA